MFINNETNNAIRLIGVFDFQMSYSIILCSKSINLICCQGIMRNSGYRIWQEKNDCDCSTQETSEIDSALNMWVSVER